MSDTPAGLNSPQYVISDLTSAFVVSGETSQTAVYPTSNTAASLGAIVGAGTVQTYTFNPKHKFVAAIRESGTADLPIKLATGE